MRRTGFRALSHGLRGFLHRHDGSAPVARDEAAVQVVLPVPDPAALGRPAPPRGDGVARAACDQVERAWARAGSCAWRRAAAPFSTAARRLAASTGPACTACTPERANPGVARVHTSPAAWMEGMREAAMAGVDRRPSLPRRRPGRSRATRARHARRWRRSRSLRAGRRGRPPRRGRAPGPPPCPRREPGGARCRPARAGASTRRRTPSAWPASSPPGGRDERERHPAAGAAKGLRGGEHELHARRAAAHDREPAQAPARAAASRCGQAAKKACSGFTASRVSVGRASRARVSTRLPTSSDSRSKSWVAPVSSRRPAALGVERDRGGEAEARTGRGGERAQVDAAVLGAAVARPSSWAASPSTIARARASAAPPPLPRGRRRARACRTASWAWPPPTRRSRFMGSNGQEEGRRQEGGGWVAG